MPIAADFQDSFIAHQKFPLPLSDRFANFPPFNDVDCTRSRYMTISCPGPDCYFANAVAIDIGSRLGTTPPKDITFALTVQSNQRHVCDGDLFAWHSPVEQSRPRYDMQHTPPITTIARSNGNIRNPIAIHII
jgi:hypothetical protein